MPAKCEHVKLTCVECGDPEATGDDGIWREVCDSHDTFTAEHEPLPQDDDGKLSRADWRELALSRYERMEHYRNHAQALAEALRDIETRSGYALIRPDKTNNDIQMEYIKQKAKSALAAYESDAAS